MVLKRLRRGLLWLFVLAVIAVPIITWFAYPPSRIMIPALAPISCGETRVCVDDLSKLAEAQALYDEALAFVNANVGQIKTPPNMYFCAEQDCSDHFGWDGVGGYNVGVFGVVIKPSGWRDYIVRHEMIHHLQNERLGMVNSQINLPPWFFEGMAYSLSDDPRRPLAWSADLEARRATFEEWLAQVGPENLWSEALKLTGQ